MQPKFSEVVALIAAMALGTFVLYPILCFIIFA